MRSDYAMFFEFPRTPTENDWLKERLETLTVKESIILDAAIQYAPPENVEDAINLLASLPNYGVCYPASCSEDLGRFYLDEAELHLSELVLAHTDMEALGCAFEDGHPGTFVRDCYVIFPTEPVQRLYNGTNLASIKDDDWSVKVKIGTSDNPEGVWLRLPDYGEIGSGPRDEINIALRELGGRSFDECTILDAKCILPEAGNLMDQYDDLAELLYDGNNLGFFLHERCQGMQGFEKKFAAATEYMGCKTLDDVLLCAEKMGELSFVTSDRLSDYAKSELKKAGAPESLIAGGLFDLEGFAKDSLERNGYSTSSSGDVYVKMRSQEQDQRTTLRHCLL